MSLGISLRPLLCRGLLLPDESLLSYLNRLAAANCYEPASILTKVFDRHLAALGLRDNLESPKHPETFDVLASLTSLAPRALANASIHHFAQAPILTEVESSTIYLSDGYPFQLLRTLTRSRYLFKAKYAQFCPDCLREAVYHRLAWTLLDVSGCLRHQCLLVNHCQNCHSTVSIQDIVRCQCGKCGANLTSMAEDCVQMEPIGLSAQRAIQTWWGVARASAADRMAWALPEQPLTVLYRLFDQLMNSIKILWSHYNRFVRTRSDQHMVQSLAFKALTDWPLGFCDFLRECLKHEVRMYSYRYGYDFSRPVYLERGSSLVFWINESHHIPGFGFIREAVERFLPENGIQVLSEYRTNRICVDADEELQKIARPIAQRKWDQLAELFELL